MSGKMRETCFYSASELYPPICFFSEMLAEGGQLGASVS